jgi:flagellar secretion chaperone FliS
MSYVADPSRAYRQNAVLSASPGQLLVMLYDGARRYLYQAGVAMRAQDIEATHNRLQRAEDILVHLRNALDHDQGQIAARLQSIYTFCLRHLRRARIERDPAKLEQVSELLGRLRDAWAKIADQ